MKAIEVLKDERFRKYLDMQIKGFIDASMANAEREIPKPSVEFPLAYKNKQLNSAVQRMRKGAELFAVGYDLFIERTGGKG